MDAARLHLVRLEDRLQPAALVGDQLVSVWGQRQTIPDPAYQKDFPTLGVQAVKSASYGVSVIDPATGAERVVYQFPQTNGIASELYKDTAGFPVPGVGQPLLAGATDGETLYLVTEAVVNNASVNGQTPAPPPAPTLLAIDLATGTRRTVRATLPQTLDAGYLNANVNDPDSGPLTLVDGQLLWGALASRQYDPATGNGNDIRAWYRIDPATGSMTTLVAPEVVNDNQFVVMSDGGLIVAEQRAGGGYAVARYDVASGTRTVLATGSEPLAGVAESPIKTLLVFTSSPDATTTTLRELDPYTGAVLSQNPYATGAAAFRGTTGDGTTYIFDGNVATGITYRPASAPASAAKPLPTHPGDPDILGSADHSIYMSWTQDQSATLVSSVDLRTGAETVLMQSPTYVDGDGVTTATYGRDQFFNPTDGSLVLLDRVRSGLGGGSGLDSYFSHPVSTVLLKPDATAVSGNVLGRYNWADVGVVTAARHSQIPLVPPGPPTVPPPPVVPPPPPPVVPGALSGFVYVDANNDGVFQPGETPVRGATVLLRRPDGAGGTSAFAAATTDGDGQYRFGGIAPGQYWVQELQPAGYLDGKDTLGTTGGALQVNDILSAVPVFAAAESSRNNFGELLPPVVPPPPPRGAVGTSTGLAISAAAVQVGEAVTLTAHVSTQDGRAVVGSVRFSDNGIDLGTAAVNGTGDAVLSGVKLRIGGRKITAAFTPADPTSEAASTSSPLAVTVGKAGSAVALSAAPVPASAVGAMTLTARVTTPSGTPAIGTVTFKNGDAVLGTAAVDGTGVAKLTLATAGSYQVVAGYAGSSTVGGSASMLLLVKVQPPAAPTPAAVVQLSVGTASVPLGHAVNLSASVSTPTGGPVGTGSIAFYDGSKLIGSVTLNAGRANLSVAAPTLGAHAYRAVFAGNAAAATGTSATRTVTVTRKATEVAVVGSSMAAGRRTLQVRVTAVEGGSPIGSVSLVAGGVVVGSAVVNGNGIASVAIPPTLATGTVVRFEYGGSSLYDTSALTATL